MAVGAPRRFDEATVRYRLGNKRDKFAATSRTHLAALAVAQGQVALRSAAPRISAPRPPSPLAREGPAPARGEGARAAAVADMQQRRSFFL
jgi:hypothetical protein